MNWFLRKAGTDEIFPEREWGELLKWANEALINPMDEVSADGVNWVPSHTIPDFEMCWDTELLDGTAYGPTNIATLREFCSARLLSGDASVRHKETGETLTVMDLLTKGSATTGHTAEAPEVLVEAAPPAEPPKQKKTQALKAPVSLASLLGKGVVAGGEELSIRIQPLPGPASPPPPPPAGALKPSLELALATDPELIALEEELERARMVYVGLKARFDQLVRERTSGHAEEAGVTEPAVDQAPTGEG
jgi:hypothetical protein